ncbi:MAG: aromatic/alkene monooxygenase hydroxylase subunit beta [Thermodesulfobacteriota bacterium]
MSTTSSTSSGLRTWSALAARKRRPTEYEVVTYDLHYRTRNPDAPYELDPDLFMNRWYKRHANAVRLQHDDWNAFRDPDELVYRTYTAMQDAAEEYVDRLLDEHDRAGHDRTLDPAWVATLARLYTPGRYPLHAVQMASAYLAQMAPASTITNCAVFQEADAFRWVSRTAYRTCELGKSHPGAGFGAERAVWEDDSAWQGFRELFERTLVAWDWDEHLVALTLVAKPALDETWVRQLGAAARACGDGLLAMLHDAQLRDAERARRWTGALVRFACERPGNAAIVDDVLAAWAPLGERAIDAFCAALPNATRAAAEAKTATRTFRAELGFAR